MKVKEIVEILNKYPDDMEVSVLKMMKPYGAGILVEVVDIQEFIDEENNLTSLFIETEEYYEEVNDEMISDNGYGYSHDNENNDIELDDTDE